MKNNMIKALKARYDASYQEAHCTLEIYLNKPVAIGEHPQHFEEMGKLVDAMASAKDSLEALNAEYPEVEMNLLIE
jgi:hypothetical protein|tara:strand:- start:4 stop:231 length:228 start_codon:yes stop_codon:yes gene_type:complete